MKKVIIFVALCLVLAAQAAYAHPPVRVVGYYEMPTKTLTVVVSHYVGNPEEHFINKILVKRGEEIIKDAACDKQDNAATQTRSWVIENINSGDVLAISAYCNKGGDLTQEITVE
ncbi:MAG: hypothetical protein V2A72_01090 [Candidatus Omnitrophota bacterium]